MMPSTRASSIRVRLIQLLRLAQVAVVVVATGASDCSGSGTSTQTAPVGFTVSITRPIADVITGTSGSMTVTITRLNGYVGAVGVLGNTGTHGVNVQAILIPAGETTGTLEIIADLDGVRGGLIVIAVAFAAGYANAQDEAAFRVVAPGTFLLQEVLGDLHVNPGGTYHTTIKISRALYTQTITLSAAVVAPFTTTLNPTTTVDNSIDNLIAVSVAVPPATPIGEYFIPIHAVGAGGVTADYNLLIAVRLPTFDFTATAPAAPINTGTTGSLSIVASRDPTFTGAVTLTGTSSSSITVTGAVLPNGTTQGTMQVTVPQSLLPGSYEIDVTGTSPGVAEVHHFVTILVGGYRFSMVTAPLTVAAGSSAQDVANITRTNFTGAVTVTGTSDPGVTVTANPSPTSGNQTTLTVTVASFVSTTIQHDVTLTGTAAGIGNVTSTFAVIVTPGPSNTTWNFCPTTGLPLWVAVQDGPAGGWSRVTGTAGSYPFAINSGSGGIAYVVQNPGLYEMHIFYGSQAELQARGASLCSNSGAVKTVTGSMINTGTAAAAYVGLGTSQDVTVPATGSYTLRTVAPGSRDLVAATVDGQPLPAGLKMLLQRGINPADGSVLAPLDFATGFAATNATLTFANALGHVVLLTSQYQSTSGVPSTYFTDLGGSSTASSRQFFGVPAAQQQAGDLHYISAQALTGSGFTTSYRTAGLGFTTMGPQTLTFGGVLNPTTVTSLGSSPQGRLRATVTTQSDYLKFWEVFYDQSSTGGKTASIQVTAAYRGTAGSVVLDIPDFSAVAGWNSVYGLIPGSTAQWKMTASTWSTTGGLSFPLLANGATFNSATAQGIVTP